MNTPQPTRAFIRHWYEWILLLGDIAAFVLLVTILLTLSVQATGGWVW